MIQSDSHDLLMSATPATVFGASVAQSHNLAEVSETIP